MAGRPPSRANEWSIRIERRMNMGNMPVGVKFRSTKDKMPKGEKLEGIGLYCSCLLMGVLTLKYGSNEISWLGNTLISLGGATTVLEVKRKHNPYRRLFESIKLDVNGSVPRYIKKRKTDYGYCVTFSLPAGLSTENFKKHQLVIEQNLNRKVEFSYKNYRVYMKVFEKELDKLIPYEFIETKNILEFAIGKVFGGKIVTVDLEKSVHLLIAGETGSGKSTLLRSILTNIILSDKKIALHLIDLKNGAEFNLFRKSKIVKSFSRTKEEAEDTLTKLLQEVNRRYDLFYENDVVDIREYNKLKNTRRLDYQICVIDEFADLQDEKGSTSIVEILAAKARACGIHLIISTQRPDMKILNGRIKANVPGVIGLKTMNEVNSRIIIDESGLEKLRGQGHGMLKKGELTEFQSMFLEPKDAKELIKHTYVEKEVKKKEVKNIGKIEDLSFLKKLGCDSK